MTQLTYQYRAVDQSGLKSKGVVQARDRAEAFRRISAAGLKPTRIATTRNKWTSKKRITVKDLSHLTYQFSVLMRAQIPVADGLRSIAEQESNPTLQNVLHSVAGSIEGGSTVTDALSSHRALFGDVYIETVRAAEASGNMTEVLGYLADMLEKQYETSRGLKSALLYPICVVAALLVAVLFLTIFVMPKFSSMFAKQGVELPLPTKALMGFSSLLQGYWYLLIAGGVAAVFGLRRALRSQRMRHKIDLWLHKVPFIRDVLRCAAVSRFSWVLGLSLRSGLSLIDALDMAGRASGRPLMNADTMKMREQVNQGRRLSDVLLRCSYLPGFARRMIAAGEESAELPGMCEIVARHYDREVAHLTRNVTTIIEPILIAGMAGLVLIVALAIFLPLWNMAALVG